MPEVLTESFCERCGTKYALGATPKARRLSRLRVLSRGLKTYVLTDEASLNDALTMARGEEERSLADPQLEAFSRTFKFCLNCRQYTCVSCWNAEAAACRTCAPLPADLQSAAEAAAAEDMAAEHAIAEHAIAEHAVAERSAAEGAAAEGAAAEAATGPAAPINGHLPFALDFDLPRSPVEAPANLESTAADEEDADAELPAPEVEPVAEANVEVEDLAVAAAPAEVEDLAVAAAPAEVEDLAVAAAAEVEDLAVAAPAESLDEQAAVSTEQPAAVAPYVEDAARDDVPFAEPSGAEIVAAPDARRGTPRDSWLRPWSRLHGGSRRPGQSDQPEAAPAADAPTPVSSAAMPTSDELPAETPADSADVGPSTDSAPSDEASADVRQTAAWPPDPASLETLLAEVEAELDREEQMTATAKTSPVPVAELDAVAELAAEPELLAEPPVMAEPEAVAEPEAEATVAAEPEPAVIAEPEAAFVAEPAAGPEPAVIAEPEATFVAEPEPIAEAAIELAAEPELLAEPPVIVQAEPEPEPAAEPEPDFVAEPKLVAEPEAAFVAEPEPAVITEPELITEPAVIAEPEPADTAEPAPLPEPVPDLPVVTPPASEDVWWIVAPDPGPTEPGVDRASQPTWTQPPAAIPPTRRPSFPTLAPQVDVPTIQRPPGARDRRGSLVPVGANDAVWAASSRDVLNRPGSGVQGCVSCGLALSAAARFCRRCGTAQG